MHLNVTLLEYFTIRWGFGRRPPLWSLEEKNANRPYIKWDAIPEVC